MRYPCYSATTDLLYVFHEISIVLPALYHGSDHQGHPGKPSNPGKMCL